METALLPSIASLISFATIPLLAADETVEIIRAYSPDKKFAMRIVCDPEFAKDGDIPAHAVHAVTLVSLPEKKEVASLMTEDDAAVFGGLKLLWSADSQWCAFYSCTNRIGYTSAYRRQGDTFTKIGDENVLSAPNDVDTRNEYVSPIRWLKPGVLLLKHHIIPRGDGEDFNAQFTATYDAKAGKFRIGGVKKLAK